MKITMIGHASLLVEADGCTALMDPVLFDPHQEGVLRVAPPREVLLDRLPPLDVIIVSHHHLDHFDVRSLAHLPRDVDVVIPRDDDLLESSFRRLGYERLRPIGDFEQITIGRTRLLATRSENRVPEHGIVFSDASGVCWNQVDTILSPGTISEVRGRCGTVDLLLAVWQPLLENDFQVNRSIAFPASRYAKMLDDVKHIAPGHVVPGSCGFAYTGSAAWMNHIVFPVTRSRFCADVETLVPALSRRVLTLDPGDTLTLSEGEVRRGHPSSFIVRHSVGEMPGDFRPVEIVSPMRDDNPEARPLDEMEAVVERELTVGLPDFIAAHAASFEEHRRWNVVHQIEIVFPNGRRRWHLDFTQPRVVAREGVTDRANLFSYMTASSLCGIVDGSRGWDSAFLTGSYRSHRALYRIDGNGLNDDGAKRVPDPIRVRFSFDATLRRVIDGELAKWSATVPLAQTARIT